MEPHAGSLIDLLNDHVDTVIESARLIEEMAGRVAALEGRETAAEPAPREPLPIPADLASLEWRDLQKVAASHNVPRGKREEIAASLEALRGAAS
jgi:hypothetical protein